MSGASDPVRVRVRMRKVPPSGSLEGFDLRPYRFHEGGVYDLERPLATMLVLWEYAEPAPWPDARDRAADTKRRRD